MKFKQIKGDLFTVEPDFYLAHCISADFALGKGIAVEFDKRYDMRNKLISTYNNADLMAHFNTGAITDDKCYSILIDNVFNLVTKEMYYEKPTYITMYRAIRGMRKQCEMLGIKKLAMPRIGCGLDNLNWFKVANYIHNAFNDLDILIRVYYLN